MRVTVDKVLAAAYKRWPDRPRLYVHPNMMFDTDHAMVVDESTREKLMEAKSLEHLLFLIESGTPLPLAYGIGFRHSLVDVERLKERARTAKERERQHRKKMAS